MSITLRPVTAGELESFARTEARANGWHATQQYVVHGQHSVAPDRTLAAFDGDELVGTSVSHAYAITVPGGELDMGGVGWVSVQPTHRRRGIMQQMLLQLLESCWQRGEPLSGLWSKQGGLFGRYGYAVSSCAESWRIQRRAAHLRQSPDYAGQLVSLHTPESRQRFPSVYEQLRKQRIGVVARDEIFWDVEFEDWEDRRHGCSGYFFTACERDGALDGYLKYRIDIERKELVVSELVANTLDAYASLWEHCFDLDRIDSILAGNRPLDDSLPWLLSDPRAISRIVYDAMWLRIVDVAAALSKRCYGTDDRIHIEVKDSVCPWNNDCFALEAGGGDAGCEPTTHAPDLSLDITVLGAAYLGGVPLETLDRAGLIDEHQTGAVRRLAKLLTTPSCPWTLHVF